MKRCGFALSEPLCLLCTVYCVLCTVYCVLCPVYYVLCPVYYVLCTVRMGCDVTAAPQEGLDLEEAFGDFLMVNAVLLFPSAR
jgi:hypothetical protein